MTVHGFWGLQVLPGKFYTQKVALPFIITMASLADTITSTQRCCLLINVDGVEFVLCSLTPEKVEQQVLNTVLMEGEEVTFSVKGDNAIHLTGNHVFDITDDESEAQQFQHILDHPKKATMTLESSDNELLPSKSNNQQKRKRSTGTDSQVQSKRSKDNKGIASSPSADPLHVSSKCEKEQQKLQSYMNTLNGHVQQLQQQLSLFTDLSHNDTLKPTLSLEEKDSKGVQQIKAKGNKDHKDKEIMAADKKKLEGKKEIDNKREIPSSKKSLTASTSASTQSSTSTLTTKNQKASVQQSSANLKVVRLPNGMVVEDKKIGSGRPAGTGSKVGLRYMGKLLTGKKFDSNTSGDPFRFVLGKGTVIRGWDIGVAGMKVGGERKLVIPPSLAYRQRGMPPDIPPNSTLVFEVKLVELQ